MPNQNELFWFVGGVVVGMFVIPQIMARFGTFTERA